jgi:glycosyltransferase involved in cell wall biosynthesis
MAPIVSVIIPAYNASKYLEEAIETVLNQSFKDFELLIIDDGSADNTLTIAHHCQEQDSRIQVISQKNQGVSMTRNYGVRQAKGKLIAFLDADDKWFPNKLETHVKQFDANKELGVGFGRVTFLDAAGNLTNTFSRSLLKDLKPHHFFYENPTVTCSNLVVRREVFDEVGFFDELMMHSEDLEWCLRVSCSQCWLIEGMDQILVQYRTSSGSLSSNLKQMEEGWELLASKAKKNFPDLISKHYSKARATYLRYLARRALRLDLHPFIAASFVTRAICTDWRIVITEPSRTIPTVLLAYFRYLAGSFNVFLSNSKV